MPSTVTVMASRREVGDLQMERLRELLGQAGEAADEDLLLAAGGMLPEAGSTSTTFLRERHPLSTEYDSATRRMFCR